MNQNYNELKQKVEHIKAYFSPDGQWRYGKVQKIYSSGKVISLAVRLPGKTINLSFGRGDKYCGVYLLEKTIPSEYRVVKDQFLEYFRKHIRGNAISNIDVDSIDRICRLSFVDKSAIYFFWKGGNLHFTHIYKEGEAFIEFSPWKSMKKIRHEKVVEFEIFDDVGRREIEKRDVRDKSDINSYEDFEKENAKLSSKAQKKLKRKVLLIEKDLEICSRWQELQDLAIRDELDLAGEKLKWKGVKISFQGIRGHYQKRDKVFDKVKKLKRGSEILKGRLEKAKESLEKNKSIKVEQKIIFPIWSKKEEIETKIIKNDNDVVYLDYKKYKIAVGKTARANDWIRKAWAKKSDIWIHLDEHRSSHVFIKNFETFNLEDFSLFCSILADYSDFSDSKVPVIFTQVSNLKGVKGTPGKVNYKKEKHLIIDKVNWKEIISTAW